MKLSEILLNYIGRNIEVFLENNIIEGTLLEVSPSNIKVMDTSSGYYGVDILSIIIKNIKHLVILSET